MPPGLPPGPEAGRTPGQPILSTFACCCASAGKLRAKSKAPSPRQRILFLIGHHNRQSAISIQFCPLERRLLVLRAQLGLQPTNAMDKLAALGKLAALAYHCFDSMSTSIFHCLTAKATGAEIIDRPDLIEKNRHGMNDQEYQVGRWRNELPRSKLRGIRPIEIKKRWL